MRVIISSHTFILLLFISVIITMILSLLSSLLLSFLNFIILVNIITVILILTITVIITVITFMASSCVLRGEVQAVRPSEGAVQFTTTTSCCRSDPHTKGLFDPYDAIPKFLTAQGNVNLVLLLCLVWNGEGEAEKG